MNFEKTANPVEEKPTAEKEKPLDLQEISEEISNEIIKGSQGKTSNFFDIERSRYEKGINLSHRITKSLMETEEREAGKFWDNLENSFGNTFSDKNNDKKKDDFWKFKSWILSTIAAMKILKETGCEVFLAPTKLDMENGIDLIATKKRKVFGIQLKGKNLSSLRTERTKIEDLVSRPTKEYRKIMEKGVEILRTMCSKKRGIPFEKIELLMLTIPTGEEILTSNGNFREQFKQKSMLLKVLNNSMIA